MLKHSSKNLNLDGMLSTYAQKHICKSTPSKLGLTVGIIFMIEIKITKTDPILLKMAEAKSIGLHVIFIWRL